MPLYTVNTMLKDDHDLERSLHKGLASLHAETFGTDPAAVRVQFVIWPEVVRYGGYGFKPAKGMFGVDKATEFLVAEIVFHGIPEEWKSYCRKILQLWRSVSHVRLRSIYLHKLEFEFEVVDEMAEPSGRLIEQPRTEGDLRENLSSY